MRVKAYEIEPGGDWTSVLVERDDETYEEECVTVSQGGNSLSVPVGAARDVAKAIRLLLGDDE